MNLLIDLPKEIVGEMASYLGILSIGRLASTCQTLKEQIWIHVHRLAIYDTAFNKHFSNTPFNFRKFINLKNLQIPHLDSQLLHLPHLTRLVLNWDGNSEDFNIVRQLTNLEQFYLMSQNCTLEKWDDTITAEHTRLTQLGLRLYNFPPGVFNVPVITKLKSLRLGVVSRSHIEEEEIAPLFDLTNLRDLELAGVTINCSDQIGGFSRLCNLENIEFIVVSHAGYEENRINFEELAALKHLTSLEVTNVGLIEKDYEHIGKLTMLEGLQISDNEAHLEHLSNFTNLTHLRIFIEDTACHGEIPLKGMTKLECLYLCQNFSSPSDLATLQRLRDLTVGDFSTDTARSQEFFGALTQMPKLRKLGMLFTEFPMSLYEHFKLLTQLRELTGFSEARKKFQAAGWDVAALPFYFDTTFL